MLKKEVYDMTGQTNGNQARGIGQFLPKHERTCDAKGT